MQSILSSISLNAYSTYSVGDGVTIQTDRVLGLMEKDKQGNGSYQTPLLKKQKQKQKKTPLLNFNCAQPPRRSGALRVCKVKTWGWGWGRMEGSPWESCVELEPCLMTRRNSIPDRGNSIPKAQGEESGLLENHFSRVRVPVFISSHLPHVSSEYLINCSD